MSKKDNCPSGKIRYHDQEQAIAALHKILSKDTRKHHPNRVYECQDCSGYHLTSTTYEPEWIGLKHWKKFKKLINNGER